MTFFNLCGAAICVVFMSLIMKEVKKDYAFLLSLSIGILFFGIILYQMRDVIAYITALSDTLPNKTYVISLLKALGIAYTAGITQEICKSCGENTVSGYIEAVGKAEIILVCLPMLRDLTETALKYI